MAYNRRGVQRGLGAVKYHKCAQTAVIQPEDFCAITGTGAGANVVPASSIPFTTLAAAQEAFHDAFFGIAYSTHFGTIGDDEIHQIGCWEEAEVCYSIAAAQTEVGEFYGLAVNATNNGLENQKLVKVATPNLAVLRCTRGSNGVNVTEVWGNVKSTLTLSGIQATA